jgi:hypothetical protein
MPVPHGESHSADYTLRTLKLFLQTAVPLWTIRFKDLSWEELKQIMRESEKVLEELGELATFAQFKKGETAKAFNAIAKAIAALSFVPQGIDIFGLHFETKYEGPMMGRVNHDAPISGEPVIGLTEKGFRIHIAMKATVLGFLLEEGSDKHMTSEENVEAVKHHWNKIWKDAGTEPTALKAEVLFSLSRSPLPPSEVMRFVMDKLSDTSSKDFEKATKQMWNAGLVTDDPSRMFSDELFSAENS